MIKRFQTAVYNLSRNNYTVIDKPRRAIPWQRWADLANVGSIFASVAVAVVISEIVNAIDTALFWMPVVAAVG